MDAADLKFFEQVAQSGGMSRAAEKLNTVQSNVTRRIRALESELNVSLFNRTGRGVSLTPAGERLLPFAIRVARLIDEAASTIGDDGQPEGKPRHRLARDDGGAPPDPCSSRSSSPTSPRSISASRPARAASWWKTSWSIEWKAPSCAVPVHHPDLLQRKMYQERLVVLTSRRERVAQRLSAKERSADGRPARRLLVSADPGIVAGPSGNRRRSHSRIRHA